MSKLIKKCSVVMLSAWLGMSVGIQEACADSIEDVTKILEIIEDIYGVQLDMQDAQELANNALGALKEGKGIEGSIQDSALKQLLQSQTEWDALTSSYNMTQETEYAFAYDVNTPNPNAQGQYTELWSPDDWNDALKTASGGNGTRYEQLKAAYEEKNPSLVNHKIEDEAVDTDKLVKNSYTQVAQTTTAALAVSQHAYEDVNERIRNLKKIMSFIDDQNVNQNEKAAIDLNSRLVAELGLIQLEMLRLQGAQAQMQASEAQDAVNHATIEKQMLGINL